MKGSPPRPGISVKCVEITQPPFARKASASGASRFGKAAIIGEPTPAPVRALWMKVVLQIGKQ